jgi:chromate transporter
MKYAGVKATLGGIRPAIVGMILATALTMFLSVAFQFKTVQSTFTFDWKPLLIFGIILAIAFGYSKWKKKAFSPILLIIISGVLGVLLFGA